MAKRRIGIVVVGLSIVVACSGDDESTAEESVGVATTADEESADEPSDEESADEPADGDEVAEDVAGAIGSEPPIVEPSAERQCERYGFACSPVDATPDQLADSAAAMNAVAAAMEGADDPFEQLQLGMAAVADIEDATLMSVDDVTATMLSFTVEGGPLLSVFTGAGEMREDGDVRPVDESFTIEPETAPAEPQGFARGFASASPERYEPAGGPTNRARTALVVNPFEWDSAGEIAAIFRAEAEYATVDVLDGSDVNPFAINDVGAYDAVHIITHGGGSCPPWTDDRDECSSTFVGGPIDIEVYNAGFAASDSSPSLDFWLCSSGGVDRYCFNSGLFPSNPDGITFFGSCGSDFGFNNAGGGATVGWTGTTQKRVAERSALAFWTLMVEHGVEFRLAEELIKGAGHDSHTMWWWASGGAVNFFTESVFSGRNLRARDVIEPKIDGNPPRGQHVQFTGTPEDGREETFPADGQEITLQLDGVREGSEAGVGFEIRADGVVWESDIDLVRDGTRLEGGEGFASWLVTLRPDSVKIPDLTWSELDFEADAIDLEVRAFENSAEYTADLGTIRLATDVVASGPLPIFEELESVIAGAGGTVEGNDLRVEFNTGGGEVTGELHVVMSSQGIEVGTWDIEIEGTYDAATQTMTGTVTGESEGGIGSIRAGDSGTGEFTGTVDLAGRRVDLTLGVGGESQQYSGTFVS